MIEVVEQTRRAFFTPKTLAEYLHLSERTVREMLRPTNTRPAILSSYKFGGQRRIHPDDVDAYVAAQKDEA